MKKIFSILLIAISFISSAQTGTNPDVFLSRDKTHFEAPDGISEKWKNYHYYGYNDHFVNPQALKINDTLWLHVNANKRHYSPVDSGKHQVWHYAKGTPTLQSANSYYETEIDSISITNPYSLAFTYIGGDTLAFMYYNPTTVTTDSIQFFNWRTMQRIGAVPFNNGGNPKTFGVGPFAVADDGSWLIGMYSKPTSSYIGRIYRTTNKGGSYTLIKSFLTVTGVIRPEELTIVKVGGGRLICYMRSDWGNWIWQSISDDNGLTWSDPERVEHGGNLPKAKYFPEKGLIVLAASRYIATPYCLADGSTERESLPDDLFHDNTIVPNTRQYNRIIYSSDNGETYKTFDLDLKRVDGAYPSGAWVQEGSDVVQLDTNRGRVYWCMSPNFNQTAHNGSVSDLSYADFIITNDKEIKFFGGGESVDLSSYLKGEIITIGSDTYIKGSRDGQPYWIPILTTEPE